MTTATQTFPVNPDTATRAAARAARVAWRRVLLGARRLPTHRVDVQFANPPSATGALSVADRVRRDLGRAAGGPVEHLAVAEMNTDRPGHHLHVLYWHPGATAALALRRFWERRSRSSDVCPLWDDPALPAHRALTTTVAERGASDGRCPDGRRTVHGAVGYATKYLDQEDVEYCPSPYLLRRIGAPDLDALTSLTVN